MILDSLSGPLEFLSKFNIMNKFKIVVDNTVRKYGPNVIDTEQYKLHVLKREYMPGQWEILVESWTPELGWKTEQYLLSAEELKKFVAEIGK
jgi:hypothetical protein